MKVLLTYVSTLNGKITKGSDPDVTKWTSKEDQSHFRKLKAKADVIIRSSKTYEATKNTPAKAGQLVIVLTRDPKKYAKIHKPGVLEFTKDKPSKVIAKLRLHKIKMVLVAVGGTLSALFFRDKLIDLFYLTIEPVVFGEGVDMVATLPFNTNFKLLSTRKLNSKGSLLLKYKVMK